MPEMLYEDVVEVEERVVLYRGEPGARSPVKGMGACLACARPWEKIVGLGAVYLESQYSTQDAAAGGSRALGQPEKPCPNPSSEKGRVPQWLCGAVWDGQILMALGWAPLGRTGDLLEVQQPVDLGALRGKLEGLLSRGIRSLAVVLMHSYT
jgi:N-methylhydantoinase A/oxoprolinase/acetone carboxylase beta subunit